MIVLRGCPTLALVFWLISSVEDRDKLQQALDCLCEWAERWGMCFNLAKCKVMHVGANNPSYDYYMRGTKLGTTVEEKDIGVIITKNLKNRRHTAVRPQVGQQQSLARSNGSSITGTGTLS
jgi:hypothetical protein